MKKQILSLIFATLLSGTIFGQSVIFPQLEQPGTAQLDHSKGVYTLSNDLLSASFISSDGHMEFGGCEALNLNPGTELFSVTLGDGTTYNSSEMQLSRIGYSTLRGKSSASRGSERLPGKAIEAHFNLGDLHILWRAVLRNGSHYLRTELELQADKDISMRSVIPMIYEVSLIEDVAAPEIIGNTRGAILANDLIFAGVESPMAINTTEKTANNATLIKGSWSRNTVLKADNVWRISSVVGIIAPGQARRSVLAYIERERAVPWRPFSIYNSWYELNIDRNNDRYYTRNYNINQCVEVMNQWKKNLYDKHGVQIKSFVWDDGWDSYGTWTFNPNFPNGFKEVDEIARTMNSSIGAWLGPVGGYGQSGDYRRAYWNNKGGMQLSNPEYYNTFLSACTDMINNYDFNFFKFDGISAQFSAVGPDNGTVGEENAEAIIDIEARVREIKPDIFLNTTVGTWASPFWFRYTDAVWRQEADYLTIGNQGSDRERWITYRDRLVYQNFIQNSPLCPINTLMTHGVILTKYGNVAKDMSYEGILRELRCAYACGSGMVELYCDFEKLNTINNGQLWNDIAECIRWQERNADVLPDIHWVGGNPWDGVKANVYGWASWNGKKSTLSLRNPAATENSFTFTLREVLDIPGYYEGKIILTPSFTTGQDKLEGLPVGEAIDIDRDITVKLAKSSVYMFDGVEYSGMEEISSVSADNRESVSGTYDLYGRQITTPHSGLYIIDGKKTIIR